MSDTGRDAPSSPQPDITASRHEDKQQQHPAQPEGAAEEERRGEDEPKDPQFEPLFTLLTNTTSNATIHPRVHYLFSDDDPSLLATAAGQAAAEPTSSSDPAAPSADRALVVDLAPDAAASGGWAVSWASSLSANFAVTDARLQAQGGEGILRLEGVEREPVELSKKDATTTATATGTGSSASAVAAAEDTDALVDDFRRRMGVLKKVVVEGEKRREVLARDTTEELPNDAGEEDKRPQQDRPTTGGDRAPET